MPHGAITHKQGCNDPFAQPGYRCMDLAIAHNPCAGNCLGFREGESPPVPPWVCKFPLGAWTWVHGPLTKRIGSSIAKMRVIQGAETRGSDVPP